MVGLSNRKYTEGNTMAKRKRKRQQSKRRHGIDPYAEAVRNDPVFHLRVMKPKKGKKSYDRNKKRSNIGPMEDES